MSKSMYVLLAILIGAVVGGTTTSVFARASGKKIEVALDKNGRPKALSLVYVYDQNWGWSLSTFTQIKPEDIESLPNTIKVSLVDLSSGKEYYQQEISKKALLYTSVVVSSPDILRNLLPAQKNAALMFTTLEGESLYYFPVGEICSNFPTYVSDLTKEGRPACAVDPKDFGVKDVQCDEQKARLLEYIKLGYVTCTSAKDIYAKMGCGELDCKL